MSWQISGFGSARNSSCADRALLKFPAWSLVPPTSHSTKTEPQAVRGCGSRLLDRLVVRRSGGIRGPVGCCHAVADEAARVRSRGSANHSGRAAGARTVLPAGVVHPGQMACRGGSATKARRPREALHALGGGGFNLVLHPGWRGPAPRIGPASGSGRSQIQCAEIGANRTARARARCLRRR